MYERDMSLVFTRYLYPKIEVRQALFLAILNKNLDESLFWVYELYHSGNEHCTFQYLFNMYNEIFECENPQLIRFLEECKGKWENNKEEHWHIGSIVATFCMRTYTLTGFVERYFKTKCLIKLENKFVEKKITIRLKKDQTDKYNTIVSTRDCPRLYLPSVCGYAIPKQYNELFDTPKCDIKKKYCFHWLYYASRSPLWKSRISLHNGIANEDKKDIEFPNDEDQEKFFDLWGIEPDEQPITLQEKSIGTGKEQQLGVRDFCDKYGVKLVTKTIKRMNK